MRLRKIDRPIKIRKFVQTRILVWFNFINLTILISVSVFQNFKKKKTKKKTWLLSTRVLCENCNKLNFYCCKIHCFLYDLKMKLSEFSFIQLPLLDHLKVIKIKFTITGCFRICTGNGVLRHQVKEESFVFYVTFEETVILVE